MPTLRAEQVAAALAKGASARLPEHAPARFTVGAAVRARNLHPHGHVRLPRYLRGRRGVVARDQGVFIFPDTHAATGAREPQRLYSVRFEAAELWGGEARGARAAAVYVDLFEPYLESAA